MNIYHRCLQGERSDNIKMIYIKLTTVQNHNDQNIYFTMRPNHHPTNYAYNINDAIVSLWKLSFLQYQLIDI